MKKSLFSILLTFAMATSVLLTSTSCGGQKTEAATEESMAVTYACPMHPEVVGKEGDTCNQCGMALEKVEEGNATEHAQH